MTLFEKPIMQVALDYGSFNEAVRMAEILRDEMQGLPYICEIGTPLIKAEGMNNVVPKIRNILGNGVLLAVDLKTLDTGDFEVQLAYDSVKRDNAKFGLSGKDALLPPDIVGIAGAAPISTIEKALAKAAGLRMIIMIDSISTQDIPGRMEWIAGRIGEYNRGGGKAMLEYHIPIDDQGRQRDYTPARRIYEKHGIPIAVAGGLDVSVIKEHRLSESGLEVYVIGGAVTRPKGMSPEEALRMMRDFIYHS